MQHEIPIAFAFDKNYLKTRAVALYSLLHAHRAVEGKNFQQTRMRCPKKR